MSKVLKFDVVDYLRTDKDIAAYIAVALEDGDPALLVAATGDIARVKGENSVSNS